MDDDAADAEFDIAQVYEPMDAPVADGRVWIDLHDPDAAELEKIASVCGLRIPTREDLSEIESSSRHYVENGALYLSAPLLIGAETPQPKLTPVGFIVQRERLVTVRFDRLKAFEVAAEAIKANPVSSGLEAFTVVIEAVIDRKADLIEQQGEAMEALSQEVFTRSSTARRDSDALRKLLQRVGHFGDRAGKMRGSLLSINRILPFVVETAEGRMAPELARRLNAAREDVVSLTAYQETLSNKVQFLLDAVLGFINIDQNDVFKILTVVSAVGVPPTLVASVYGMNFKAMPELNWAWGYPYALALIVVSTILPLWWFRRKGWF